MMKRIRSRGIYLVGTVLVGLLMLTSGLVVGQDVGRASEAEASAAAAVQLGTGFSFQGVLEDGEKPLNGFCDMQFSLWDADSEGTQIGATEVITDVEVVDGLFNVELNRTGAFGATAFRGDARWLEVGVRCAEGTTDFTALTPRQPLTAVPYAHSLRPGASIYAATGTALTVESVSSSASSLIVDGHSTNSAFPTLRVNNDGAGGYGFYVGKTNGAGVAVFGANNGTTGSGTVGYSNNWYGIYGYTGTSNHNYGIYSPDNLFTRNVNMTGAMMMVAQNGGVQTLEAGDVASFAGISTESAPESQPMIQVAPTTLDNRTAVAGVVHGRFPRVLLNAPPEGLTDPNLANFDPTAPIRPGDLMLMVVYGPAQVKAGALTTAVQPGDALTVGSAEPSAERPILTAADDTVEAGAVFGKALEASGDAQDLLYIFVTLQ